MKSTNFSLVRYDADEGMVFDGAEPHYNEIPIDPEHPEAGMKQEREHLYVKTLFIGGTDSLDNYIEMEDPANGNSEN